MGATTCTRAAVLVAIAVCNIAAIFGREFLTGITNSFAGGSGPRDGGLYDTFVAGQRRKRGSQRTVQIPKCALPTFFERRSYCAPRCSARFWAHPQLTRRTSRVFIRQVT